MSNRHTIYADMYGDPDTLREIANDNAGSSSAHFEVLTGAADHIENITDNRDRLAAILQQIIDDPNSQLPLTVIDEATREIKNPTPTPTGAVIDEPAEFGKPFYIVTYPNGTALGYDNNGSLATGYPTQFPINDEASSDRFARAVDRDQAEKIAKNAQRIQPRQAFNNPIIEWVVVTRKPLERF